MSETNLKPTLHLIQKNLSNSEFDLQTNRMTNNGDQLVFMGDCVFNLTILNQSINQLEGLTIYVIDSDFKARALDENLTQQVIIIDFEQFVSLTINADKVITW
ncbi:MAG: sulfurtransferase complex subunit TusB [Kangiella sp.]|nr:MAG: sulfurtransferase complex subunit TusB [Kangiella sp.]